MQQYLSLNVLSITQLKENKNYLIKLTNYTTHVTTQIDNEFTHGFEYVYQLWPCRRGSYQQISIEVSTITNQKTQKIGEASPFISHSAQGQKYKFYETSGQHNLIVLTFKVIKLNIPEDSSKAQQLKVMNEKMQKYLQQCRAQLQGYKQFLLHTNNVIKELSKDQEPNQYKFGRFQGEYEQQQFKSSKTVSPIQKQSKVQEQASQSKEKSLTQSLLEKVSEKQQKIQRIAVKSQKNKHSQSSLRETKKSAPKSQQQPTQLKEQDRSQNQVRLEQSEIRQQDAIPTSVNKEKAKNKVEIGIGTSNAKKSERSRSIINQLEPKLGLQDSKSLLVSNVESKISSSVKESLIKQKKKRNILSKFSYLQRNLNSYNSFSNEVKQQPQQLQNELQLEQITSPAKLKDKKNKYLKAKYGDKSKKQRKKQEIQTPYKFSSDNSKDQKEMDNQQPNQFQNVTEQIRKRREAYKNMKMISRHNTSINLLPQTIQTPQISAKNHPKTPKTPKSSNSPQTPIAELTISAVKQYQSQFSQNRGLSNQRASQLKQVFKKSLKKTDNIKQSAKNDLSTKVLQTELITDRKKLQSRTKRDSFKKSSLSLDKQKELPVQKQEVKIQKEQDQLVKQNKTTDITTHSQINKSRSVKMEVQKQFKVERRKKHVKSKTQAERQSIVGSNHHIESIGKYNHKLSKQQSKIQNSERFLLNTRRLIMRIWSIRITTLTLGQAKSKRCQLQNGKNKFQTIIKDSHENYVQWDDKITIKNVQPHSCLYLTLISLPYKYTVVEGCATVLLAELIDSKLRHHKAYLYKDNLAVGNIQFKYTIEEEESQRLTFNLPQIKKQQYAPTKQKNSKNSQSAKSQVSNNFESLQGQSSRIVAAENLRQSQPYNSKIKQAKKRRYLVQ